MSKMKPSLPSEIPEQRLEDMLENIGRIRAYVEGRTRDDYLGDTMVQDAVERCFERITEAARKIGDRFDAGHPAAEFPKLRDFGGVLRHDYDRVDPALMWSFAKERLDVLEKAVGSVLDELTPPKA